MSSRDGGPLFLIKNDLTGRRIAPHSYQRPVVTGLVLLLTLDFFGEGDLCHVVSIFPKVSDGQLARYG